MKKENRMSINRTILAAVAALLTAGAARAELTPGAGLVLSVPLGDLDTGYGITASVDYDLVDVAAVRLSATRIMGDVDDAEISTGSYESTGLEIAFLIQGEMNGLRPYGGMGIGYYWNEVDDNVADDKLGRFFIGGARFHLTEALELDLNARYLQLRSDGRDFEVIDMDSLLFTAGARDRF
jgi:hypothetical protein